MSMVAIIPVANPELVYITKPMHNWCVIFTQPIT